MTQGGGQADGGEDDDQSGEDVAGVLAGHAVRPQPPASRPDAM
jgi:hypothetical protein